MLSAEAANLTVIMVSLNDESSENGGKASVNNGIA